MVKRIESIREVYHIEKPSTHVQLVLTANYRNTKTKEVRTQVESHSFAYRKINYDKMLAEAIEDGKNHCGGTNWVIIKRLIENFMWYKLMK